jgi:hypothetical protein
MRRIVNAMALAAGLATGVAYYVDHRSNRQLDQWAARRMISHVCGPLSMDKWGTPRHMVKTDDDLIIEAWLWRRYGEDKLADVIDSYRV